MRALLLCVLLAAAPARAGQGCGDDALSVDAVRQSMALAQRSAAALEDSGARVALIARAGQDLSKYQVEYSHMAIAVRDHPAGRWRVVHELNECGSDRSALFVEGLGNFFLTDLYRYRAQIVIPGPALQERLLQRMTPSAERRLHEPHYNMLSYVYSTRYQNSNQWLLEMLAAASAAPGQVETRREAQAWLQGIGYRPRTVEVGALERLGARMFRANVAFDDHPFARRMAGHIDTVTVDAVLRLVQRLDPQARVLVLD
ncbi:DUF2145 domain-containing protein [Massilia sp. 9096]|uniref:DUF2145 domain-containing protein n=1 Tax=Massilia sp. 9096 TaxID=1500894 RepID=UPI000690D223|nr:DUF2145 domain-containing protein [Massilia sp. 9096]